jgi:peptidoglycan hydrolase CwlO-like protein
MAQTIEELMELGLSKAEAERVINRKAKAVAKSESSVATAEKRLPKAQAELDHAADRVEHWQAKAEAAQKKVDKYVGIIEGNGEDAGEDDTVEADEAAA